MLELALGAFERRAAADCFRGGTSPGTWV